MVPKYDHYILASKKDRAEDVPPARYELSVGSLQQTVRPVRGRVVRLSPDAPA